MKIGIFQANTIDNKIEENIIRYNSILESLEKDVELLVMPEMFTTGFTIDPNYAETMQGMGLNWMIGVAKTKNIAIAGSLFINEDGRLVNRHFFVFPNGEYEYYDKKHLFCLSKEPELVSPGNKKLIVNYKGWRFNILTCYDLRFPLWARNSYNDGDYAYDVLIYVASWPEARAFQWTSLLRARAIENVSYLIGVNRVGVDNTGLNYTGDSVILNFKGEALVSAAQNKEEILYHTIDKESLSGFRVSFPVGRDWD